LLIGLHYSSTGIPTIKMSPPEVSDFDPERPACPSPLPYIKSSVCEQNLTVATPSRPPRANSTRIVYYRPGKKPAAEYEPDPLKLQTSCEQRDSTDSAFQWILKILKDSITLEALVRRVKLTEIERMNLPGGFEPCLACDGFFGEDRQCL